MLDEKDLQAIRAIVQSEVSGVEQRMDQKLTGLEQRMDQKLTETEQRISKNTVLLMDAEFSKRFDLLAEGQELILQKLERHLEDADIVDTRISALEAMVKKLNREVGQLKKAN